MNRKTVKLKDDWEPIGKGKELADFLNQVARWLNNFHVIKGGDLQCTKEYMRLRCKGEDGSAFSGTYYFKGKLYELTGDRKTYWYHDAASGEGSWSDGPMPDPMPASQYWRKTSTCNSVEYIQC